MQIKYIYKGQWYSSLKELVEGSGTKNSYKLIAGRLGSGWTVEDALEKPKVTKTAHPLRALNSRGQKCQK